MLPEFPVLIVFIPHIESIRMAEGEVLTGSVEPVGGIEWHVDGTCGIAAANDELWSLIQKRTEQLIEQGISGPAFCEQFSNGNVTYKGQRLAAMPPHHLRKLEKSLNEEILDYEE
jgi:hypothetical protein